MIRVEENILLRNFTTLRIGGEAKYFLIIKNEDDLKEAISFAKKSKLAIFVLGGGSNILVSDSGFSGLVIKNEIKGIKFIEQMDGEVVLEVGSGENLDNVIALSVIRKLSGLENLSGIPGTIGGASVQNAGAYGVELKDCLVSISGINLATGKKINYRNFNCQYGYRDSIFKKNKKIIITKITLKLSKKPLYNLEYLGLRAKLSDDKGLTVEKIRKAVLDIRAKKLPDWHKVGTAGSFFKNLIINQSKFDELREIFPLMPGFFESVGMIKVPLAWILDNVCNLKNYRVGDVCLYEKQPIVLVNLGGATEKDVINFTKEVSRIIKEKINLNIEWEVERIN